MSMLCTKDHEVYHYEMDVQCPFYEIPIFHNLTHLELHGRLELVLQKLQHFPNLQKLELHEASFAIFCSDVSSCSFMFLVLVLHFSPLLITQIIVSLLPYASPSITYLVSTAPSAGQATPGTTSSETSQRQLKTALGAARMVPSASTRPSSVSCTSFQGNSNICKQIFGLRRSKEAC
ncbi:hypothetical protein P8452_65273 [Trifolium repens]|nr:hypothetical protein P8452_65273 [Trifolium repens]